MEQSLKVFRDSLHSFYIFGVRKCKNQRFWWKIVSVHFSQIEVQLFTIWFRLLKAPNIWNLIYGKKYASLKNEKKIKLLEIS